MASPARTAPGGPAPAAGGAAPSGKPTGGLRSRIRSRDRATRGELLQRYGGLGILIFAIIVFSLLKPESFPTFSNARSILISQGVLALITIGLLFPLATGEFDLSIGFVVSFATMALGGMTANLGFNPVLAIVLTVAIGATIGLVNGFLIIRVRINSFIATLATGTILSGLTIWISGGQIIAQGIPDLVKSLGQDDAFGLGLPIYAMVIAAVIATFVLRSTPFGRFLYAVGGGRETARLAGVATGRLVIAAFVISGAMAALAAIFSTGLSGSASPTAGAAVLLPAFAAAFLGATMIEPGRFNVMGAIVALFLLAVLVAGLQQLGAPFWVSPVLNGSALIIAVGITTLSGPRERHL